MYGGFEMPQHLSSPTMIIDMLQDVDIEFEAPIATSEINDRETTYRR